VPYLYKVISMRLKRQTNVSDNERLTSSSRAGATSIVFVEILPDLVNKLGFQRRERSNIDWDVSTGWGVKRRKLC
jgi:hypothetical protein